MKTEFPTRMVDKNVLVISLGKSLDNSNAYILLEQLESALDGNFTQIFLDLKECELLSSSGVGAIISNVEAAQAIGSRITLLQPSQAVMTIIDALGLIDVLSIENSPLDHQKAGMR